MLSRLQNSAVFISLIKPLAFSRCISIPYRKMAGIPSTYDGTLLLHRKPQDIRL